MCSCLGRAWMQTVAPAQAVPSLMLSYVCIYCMFTRFIAALSSGTCGMHRKFHTKALAVITTCRHVMLLLEIYQKRICTLRAQAYTTGYSMHLLARIRNLMYTRVGGGGGKQGITKHAPCTDGGQTLQFISAQVIFDRQAYPCHLVMCNVLTKQCLGMSNDICFPVLVTYMSRQSL